MLDFGVESIRSLASAFVLDWRLSKPPLSLFARNRGNFCLINDIGFGIFPLPSIVELSLHPSRDPFKYLGWEDSFVFLFLFFLPLLACHFSSLIEEECFPRQSMHRGVMFTGPTRNYHVLGSI